MILTLLKNTSQFCRMFLSLVLSDVFLWFKWSYAFSGKNMRKITSLPSQCIAPSVLWCHVFSLVILSTLNVDKVISAAFLHCKFAASPFVINKYLERDTLRLCRHPIIFTFCPLILLSMNLVWNNCYCFFRLMVIFVFHLPLHWCYTF